MDSALSPYLGNAPTVNYGDVVNTPLLWGEVRADTPDMEDVRMQLWLATKSGYEGVAKLLLDREDINPNEVDTKYGRTPLSWAAQGGHESVVILLLGRKDINPNTSDSRSGLTPLVWAAKRGHKRVVRALL